jgi:hypothetical protein
VGVEMTEVASRRRWWALGVLSLAVVVIGMDNFILNLALPTLVRELAATASELQWMVDAYVVVFAGLLLSMGAVGDRFGRKRILNLGLGVFVAASAASAWAGSAGVLIGARGGPGRRRRDDLPGDAVDRHRDVPACPAWPGDRCLGGHGRPRELRPLSDRVLRGGQRHPVTPAGVRNRN